MAWKNNFVSLFGIIISFYINFNTPNKVNHLVLFALILFTISYISMILYLSKTTIFTSLFIFISIITNAQNNFSISGNMIHDKRPLEFVTISLYNGIDSNILIASTISDSAGRYELRNLPANQYILQYNLIGFKKKKVNVSITNKSILMDTITFVNVGNNIGTIKVVGQKKMIQKTEQGFIVNADANLTQAGGTATDVLKNTPTIAVDADGGITMRGKTPLIFINGKASFLSNTDLIPASSIESIEIINNASAKYNANAESGIINIKLKKNKLKGTNGAFVVGAGYGAKPRLSSSVLLNHKTKKWNIGLGYDNRYSGRSKYINGNRTNYFLTEINTIIQTRNDRRAEKMQNLRLNADYTINEKNSITFEAIGNREGQDNYEDLNSVIQKAGNLFGSNTNRNSAEIEVANALEFTTEYNRKYNDDRKNLGVVLSTSLDFNRQNTAINSQALNKDNSIFGAPYYDRTHNYENGHLSNIAINYAMPLSKKALLETGYLGTIRGIIADYEAALLVNNNYEINAATTNIYTFTEQVHAAYALYNSSFGKAENIKWKYNIGVRAEQVNNNGHTTNNGNPFVNNYLKIFPSGTLAYHFNEESALKFSYGKRINRPSLEQLNPFKDVTDTLNPHSGNPYLKPEMIHALEIGYNLSGKKYSLSSNAYYRYSTDAIRGYAQLQPNGANLILPINIGTAVIYGWENMATYKPVSYFDVNVSVSIFQQKINGSNNNTQILNDAFGWNGKLINNFLIQKKNKLQIIANYNSALITPQGKRIAQYFVDMGYQQKLGKGNAKLGLTVVDMFNTLQSGYANAAFDFRNSRVSKADTRAIMLTYAYTFKSVFKDHLLENQFSREY
jgi:outer membrane receptor protein involved in Fe transport